MLSPAPPSCVCVHGVLRSSENPSSFVPPNAGGEFFWIDVPALAAAAGLPASTPLVEVIRGAGDAVQPPATYPVVRWAVAAAALDLSRPCTQPQEEASLLRFTVMPDDHRNYAATWLTLAAAMGFLSRRAVAGRAQTRR